MAGLWVVRHGQASLFKANYDELSERGRAQSTALGEHLVAQGLGFDAVFTGPAQRQRDTARLCGEAVVAAGGTWPDVVELPGLDEHDAYAMVRTVVGKRQDDARIMALQGELLAAKSKPERSRGFQRLFEAVMELWLAGEVAPEDAETWPDFAARVEAALASIVATPPPRRRLIAFTSVGPLAVLLRRALGTDELPSFRTGWRIRNASITRFEFSGDRLTLDGFNALPHLPDPQTWTFR